MTQLMLAGKGIGPEQDVRRLLCDAEGERRNGSRSTDSEILAEHLVDALTELQDLKGVPRCELTEEKRKSGEGCDIEPMCAACALVESQKARNCGLTPEERESGKACPVWGWEELEKCCACELADEKRDRAKAEHEAEVRFAEAIQSAGPADALAALRSGLAIAGARLDCGMEVNERAAYRFCLRADLPGGDCATCSAAKMQRENEGLKNTIEVIREERDRFLIEAQTKALRPAKAKPVKVADDGTPSLFALMPQHSMTAPKMRRKRAKPVH
jgi:hypothetical protein